MKAQVTGEFIIILSVMLILFYMFYALYANQTINSYQANERIVSMRVATEVQSAINYVYLAGDGTAFNTSIRTSGINVTISNGVVEARSQFSEYDLPLLTNRINITTINPGTVVLRNNRGVIGIG
jgi:hypothetical protein